MDRGNTPTQRSGFSLATAPVLCVTTLSAPVVHVFIGMRGSGKSTGMKHVMHSMRNSFDNGILMSATEEVNEFFGKIIPGLFTYQKYRPDVIKAFVRKQRKAKLRGQPLQRVFLVLEDMMYDKQILRTDKWLAYLFQNGRHLQATLIISSQYAMSLPPEFRSQVGESSPVNLYPRQHQAMLLS